MATAVSRYLVPFKLALTLPVLLTLSACATAPQVPPTQRVKTEGFVVAKAVSNSKFALDAFGTSSTIGIESVDGGSHYNIKQVSHGIYAGWIPAGTYKIASIITTTSGGMATGLYDGKHLLTPFHVSAGRVVDLGEIIFQSIGDAKAILIPAESGLDVSKTVSTQQPAVAKILLSQPVTKADLSPVFPLRPVDIDHNSGLGLIPDLLIEMEAQAAAGDKQLRWDTAENVEDLLKLAKQSTVRLFSSFFAKDGTGLFGSTLGQVLVRSANGQWHNLDTGYPGDITGIVSNNGTIIAAFRDGTILFSKNNGAAWQPVPLEQKLQDIRSITNIAEDQYLLVNEARGPLVAEVYRLTMKPQATLKAVGRVPLNTDDFWGVPPARTGAFVAVSQGRLFIGKDADHLAIYDIEADRWTNQETPDSYRSIWANNNNTILSLHGIHGLFGTDYISTDGGITWQDANAPSFTYVLHFATEDKGFAYHSGTVDLTYNGGRSWVEGTDLDTYCIAFFVNDKTDEAICSIPSGKILSSSDGRHWTVERDRL